MKTHDLNWTSYYQKKGTLVYPTEWILRTLGGGNYPNMKLNKEAYQGSRLLDLSCGDGRNLEFLRNLGFDVTATEITGDIISDLQAKGNDKWEGIEFQVGKNHKLPFDDNSFDYVLACHSIYYLDEGITFRDVLKEVSRILRPGGYFIGSMPDSENSVLNNAKANPDGSYTISDEPFGLRNGYRFQSVNSKEQVEEVLSPQFEDISIGHERCDYFGILVSGYFWVCVASKS